MTGNLVLGGDDRKITFGTSNDLEIYHSGSDSYIRDVGTGGLRLTGSQIILRNAANSGHMLNAVDGGAVSLYHNTSTRLETTSTGIKVTGKIVAGDSSSTGGDVLLEGYYGNGATSVIGSEYSSGGLFLGYGVHPSTTTQGQFLSSSVANLSQGAYVVSDTHKWYTVTAGSSVAVGSQLTTMTERMRIKSDGYVGIGTDNPLGKFVVSNAGAEGIEFFPGSSSNQNSTQHYNRSGSAYVKNRTIALNHEWVNGGTDPAMNLIPDGNSTFLVVKAKASTYSSTANLSLYGTNPSLNGGSLVSRATIQAQTDGTAFGTKLSFFTNNTSNVETKAVTIDAAQNVGIGTDNPTYTLDVAGDIGVNEYIYHNDDTNTYMRFQDDSWLVRTAGDDRLVINSSGNVGIGTAGPGAKLAFGGSNANIWLNNDASNPFGIDTAPGELRLFTGNANSYQMKFGKMATDGTTFTSHLTIGDDGSNRGYVGIGTDSPNDILDIRKANSQLRLTDSDDNKFVQFSYSGGKLITRNNSTNTTVNQITLSEGGYVGIGIISPQTTIDLSGALLMRANPTQIGLGTFTPGNGMTVANGGELQFMHMWSGVMTANDTIVFTYAATSWKSWWFEITAASTSGYGHSHIGGYANNSLGYHDLETIHTSMWSLAASNNGQALTFTVTLNANWIHPLIKIKFGCGGGEGVPQLSKCSLVITS